MEISVEIARYVPAETSRFSYRMRVSGKLGRDLFRAARANIRGGLG